MKEKEKIKIIDLIILQILFLKLVGLFFLVSPSNFFVIENYDAVGFVVGEWALQIISSIVQCILIINITNKTKVEKTIAQTFWVASFYMFFSFMFEQNSLIMNFVVPSLLIGISCRKQLVRLFKIVMLHSVTAVIIRSIIIDYFTLFVDLNFEAGSSLSLSVIFVLLIIYLKEVDGYERKMENIFWKRKLKKPSEQTSKKISERDILVNRVELALTIAVNLAQTAIIWLFAYFVGVLIEIMLISIVFATYNIVCVDRWHFRGRNNLETIFWCGVITFVSFWVPIEVFPHFRHFIMLPIPVSFTIMFLANKMEMVLEERKEIGKVIDKIEDYVDVKGFKKDYLDNKVCIKTPWSEKFYSFCVDSFSDERLTDYQLSLKYGYTMGSVAVFKNKWRKAINI